MIALVRSSANNAGQAGGVGVLTCRPQVGMLGCGIGWWCTDMGLSNTPSSWLPPATPYQDAGPGWENVLVSPVGAFTSTSTISPPRGLPEKPFSLSPLPPISPRKTSGPVSGLRLFVFPNLILHSAISLTVGLRLPSAILSARDLAKAKGG